MKEIDLKKLKDTLPKTAQVTVGKERSICYIDCEVKPGLSDSDFEMVKNWQRQIIGELISEFYTYTEGGRWRIWLKRVQIEFINVWETDINNFLKDSL